MKLAETLEIRLRRLNEIKPLPGNAKLHDLSDIMSSIQTFGFIDPIGVNPQTGHDVDGNGRLEALKTMYVEQQGSNPPKNIVVKHEKQEGQKAVPVWYVPTIDLPFDPETEQRVALRLNRSNTKGGYDQVAVLAILDQASAFDCLEETGFDLQAYEQLSRSANGAVTETDQEDPETKVPLRGQPPRKPAEPPTAPSPSDTRTVQLFFTGYSQPLFLERCNRLLASGTYVDEDQRPVENISQLMFAMVELAESQLADSEAGE